MSENQGVWGIEIGQAGLKAIRLRYAEAADQVIAVAFDYVPHPKILSQPDAVPDELISQALDTFLSRNDVRNDLLAISVPGQTAFIRFVQLPPVQAAKVADIVKFEARQQIPFALEDVIWDYQLITGGQEESEFMLDAEVGLFAMKREQVAQHLKPFATRKIEPELVQAAPLALYNVLSFDQLGLRKGSEEVAKEEYSILLDMGADNTTLLVSNGQKIWIRNVPIGGNHFTRALTKEMKLTFAKAEHLKCNATKTEDPRAVFQAMRPVFNDYVAEIQRSIGYFSSVNRSAKIAKVIGIGNGFKLAGLQKFLQQNLQYPVERLERYEALVGDAVLGAPLFDENKLTFVVPYGLALQALGLTRIHTSLLPPEILMARKIRQKKPWAVAAAALLLTGFALSAVGYASVWRTVSPDRFGEAEKQVADLNTQVGGFKSEFTTAQGKLDELNKRGNELIRPLETREYWLELYKGINECLPRPEGEQKDEREISKQHRINILSIGAQKIPDATAWYSAVAAAQKMTHMLETDRNNPPQGEAYLVTLDGLHHFHDPDWNDGNGWGALYIVRTLLDELQEWTVPGTDQRPIDVRRLGITHATIIEDSTDQVQFDPEADRRNNNAAGPGVGPNAFPGLGPMGRPAAPRDPMGQGADAPAQSKVQTLHETRFKVQFLWRPVPSAKRPIYTALHQFFTQPKPTALAAADGTATPPAAPGFAEAQTFLQENHKLTLAQEDYDAYIKLFGPNPDPQAAISAATVAPAGDAGAMGGAPAAPPAGPM